MSTNEISTSINTLNEKVGSVKESLEKTKGLMVEKKDVASKHHEEVIEGLEGAFIILEKSIKEGSHRKIHDKTIPLTHIFPQPITAISSSILYSIRIYNSEKNPTTFSYWKIWVPIKRQKHHLLVSENQSASHVLPAKEPIPWNMPIPTDLDIYSKGKILEVQSFA